MPIQSGKRYVLINKQSGTALDLDTGTSNVQGWARHGGPNQQWQVNLNGESSNWIIKNVQQNTFLNHQNPTQEGKRIVCSREPNSWTLTNLGGNVYRINVLGSNQSIDLADHGNAGNGTPVQLWANTGGDNQKWDAQEV